MPYTSFATIRDEELLLGKCTDNLTKVNTSAKINMDIQHTAGLAVCANLFFLFRLFTEVQNEATKHPLLHKSTMQLYMQSPINPYSKLCETNRLT